MKCNLLNPPAHDPKQPFIKFVGDTRIRFLLGGSDEFFTKTNVVNICTGQMYQFSNRSNIGKVVSSVSMRKA